MRYYNSSLFLCFSDKNTASELDLSENSFLVRTTGDKKQQKSWNQSFFLLTLHSENNKNIIY